MNKRVNWGGPEFIRVSKKRYENFIRYFKDSIETNAFMDWCDSYDWSLRSGKYKIGTFKNANECMVARHYFGGPIQEFYIRVDYIKAKNYDLDTIVPKPRKKRLSKKWQKLADHMVDAFDYAFRYEAEKSIKK